MTEAGLRLVEPDESMRAAFVEYCAAFAGAGEGRSHDASKDPGEAFDRLLRETRLAVEGMPLRPGLSPQRHYFLVDGGGDILGTIRLRTVLTDSLLGGGGNVGYDVRPSQRRRGRATRMLRLVLDEARRLGLKRVMLSCDRENLASARVIRKCGGRLDAEFLWQETHRPTQRYWIELDAEPT